MMKSVVIDSSALIPLFFEEDGTAAVQEFFSSGGHRCLAPAFLAIEFSNVLTTGIRRKSITLSEASRHLRDFQSMGLDLRVFPSVQDLQQVLDVAERTKLSFYDAIYLVLARQEGALLASYDRKLKIQADQEGVELVNL